MLSELRSEREQIEEAIIVLQRLAMGARRRRGRPPKRMSPVPVETGQGKRRVFSAATRKRMAAAQRKRWAARRKAEA